MKGFRSKYSKSGSVRQNELLGGIQTGFATSIFTGDPIAVVGGFIVRATAASQNVAGIFKGVKYINSAGEAKISAFWPASTAATKIEAAYEPVDDDVVFEVLADGIVPQTALGQYANFAFGTGSTLSGQSAAVLSVATINAASTGLAMRIVGIINQIETNGDNNVWGSATTRVLVTFLRTGNSFVA